MNDLDYALLDAWARVEPMLKRNPAELARRLARRRSGMLLRPLRHYCLAVRACDQRLNYAAYRLSPRSAVHAHLNPHHPNRYAMHTVTLDVDSFRELCAPVRIDPGGEEWSRVAGNLGVRLGGLRKARRKGVFVQRFVKGLGGKHGGSPIPILHAKRAFDPGNHSFWSAPDPLLGSLWGRLFNLLPKDFYTTIQREPLYTAPPKHVQFQGWRWRCPGCNRLRAKVYLPIAPINLPTFFGLELNRPAADRIPEPPMQLACERCHRIVTFCRLGHSSWNHLIAHLSGGLIYGHEVKRPAWLTHERKRPYKPQINHRPSKRRQQVLERLLQGWTHRAIVKDLGINRQTIDRYCHTIFQQHRVHTRFALAKQYGVTLPLRNPRRDQVRELLAAGKSYEEIAKEMGITISAVSYHGAAIRRERTGEAKPKRRRRVRAPIV